MKNWNWLLIVVILIGFMLGSFIGSFFPGTWLGFGSTFGMSQPVVLELGFISFTFGVTIQMNIASVIGVIIALLLYRFLRR